MTQVSVDHRRFVGYLIIVLLVSTNIFRAYTQSITYDEAVTYNQYVSQGWATIFLSWSSNNHAFHSILMKFSTDILGSSHVSIRIPALIGGILYLLAVERLCRIFCKGRVDYVLSLSALATSPFILDFLVIARGYSLALGFLMLSLFLCGSILCRTEVAGGRRHLRRTYFLISCLSALSVASNLSFAFVNVSLLVVSFSWSRLLNGLPHGKPYSREEVWQDFKVLVIPGSVLFLLLNPAILKIDRYELYWGSQNWSQVYRSLIEALFDDFVKKDLWSIPLEPFMWVVYNLPWLFALCILVGGIEVLKSVVKSYQTGSILDGNQKLWLFVFAIIAVTMALHSLAYLVLGVLLPKERTGIFFVSFSMLLAAISIGTFRRSPLQSIFRTCGRMSLLFAVIYFLSSFHWNYFRNWKYDSGSKDIFLALRALKGDYYQKLGIDWLLEPSLNFYRIYYNDYDFLPFTKNKPHRNQTYFVLLPYVEEDRQFIRTHDIKIIYQHPVSKAIIGVKR